MHLARLGGDICHLGGKKNATLMPFFGVDWNLIRNKHRPTCSYPFLWNSSNPKMSKIPISKAGSLEEINRIFNYVTPLLLQGQHEPCWNVTKYIYSSAVFKYNFVLYSTVLVYFHFLVLYTSTLLHLREKCCTFPPTTFIFALQLLSLFT